LARRAVSALVFSRNTGRGGTYDYFICVKKKTKTNNCHRPAVRVEKIEEGIARFYGQFKVPPEYTARISGAIREELAAQQADAKRGLDRATKSREQVQDERQKLLAPSPLRQSRATRPARQRNATAYPPSGRGQEGDQRRQNHERRC
jgi:hypothetical protein